MKLLKNILLIVLVIGMTIPENVFRFAVHIPAYIHHFHHHNAEHGHIGLTDFVSEHSNDADHHSKDQHDHEHLPFSHQHTSDCNHSLTFVPMCFRQSFQFHLPVCADNKIIANQPFPNSEFSSSIWQPPKLS